MTEGTRETAEEYKERQTAPALTLQGCATDHIWCMEDIPGLVGVRMDCGDSGVVYLTYSQATDLSDQLKAMVA